MTNQAECRIPKHAAAADAMSGDLLGCATTREKCREK
jgi:hypothetical protein